MAAGAAALGASELLAGLVRGAPSPIIAVGDLVVALQPPGAKQFVVDLFGTADKLVLNLLIGGVALAGAAALGVLALHRRTLATAGFAVAALAALESLLSAKVADGMTNRKHRPNMELLAQGVANIASAFFGGISVTGTIARTATNIRAGARSPLSGMMHAAFLLAFMLVAAPLASYVPLAALAGVLVVVSWTMAEKQEFVRLLPDRRAAAVLLATFGLTLVKDLTAGILAGCLLAAVFAALDRIKAKN